MFCISSVLTQQTDLDIVFLRFCINEKLEISLPLFLKKDKKKKNKGGLHLLRIDLKIFW